MTDLSKIFKTTIKAIRLNLNIKTDLNEELNATSNRKKTTASKKAFVSQDALNIVKNVTKLKEFLILNKQNYIQPNYLVSDEMVISDEERLKIDQEAENIIHTCVESVNLLKQRAYAQADLTEQHRAHLESLFFIIDRYLKDVCKIHSEQRAIHVQRTIEKKNFSQLYTPSIKNSNMKKPQRPIESIEDKPDEDDKTASGLSIEDIQTFEQENDALYDNLTVMGQEIRQIESQVIEISRLQQVFTEKIFEQEGTIDYIQTTAVKTTDNIRLGNEELQDAMRKKGEHRLVTIFTLLVLAFSLLFLDWYNP